MKAAIVLTITLASLMSNAAVVQCKYKSEEKIKSFFYFTNVSGAFAKYEGETYKLDQTKQDNILTFVKRDKVLTVDFMDMDKKTNKIMGLLTIVL